MAEHDPAVLMKSPVFIALNQLIDQKAASLQRWESLLRDKIQQMLQPPVRQISDHIRVRVVQEGEREIPRMFAPYQLEDVAKVFAFIAADEAIIAEMQRYKLRLLNDYDFTHGNSVEQIAVFGDPSAQ